MNGAPATLNCGRRCSLPVKCDADNAKRCKLSLKRVVDESILDRLKYFLVHDSSCNLAPAITLPDLSASD